MLKIQHKDKGALPVFLALAKNDGPNEPYLQKPRNGGVLVVLSLFSSRRRAVFDPMPSFFDPHELFSDPSVSSFLPHVLDVPQGIEQKMDE